MTDEIMNLRALIEKSPHVELLREMINFAAQRSPSGDAHQGTITALQRFFSSARDRTDARMERRQLAASSTAPRGSVATSRSVPW